MRGQGIEDFHNQRKELIQEYSKKACCILMDDDITIDSESVAAKVEQLFKENEIDTKYLVGSQSIGRNKEYSNIWKDYKHKQRHKRNAEKNTALDKVKGFELRDKYDMLTQDYIELLDNKKWIEHQLNILKQENKRLSESILGEQSGIEKVYSNSESRAIFEALKILVDEGATVVLKKEGKVTIKSHAHQDESKRYEFPEELWNKL